MEHIKKFLTKEYTYFNRLGQDAKDLMASIFLYNLIGPIFSLFINAFLWRQSHDITLVAFYNLVLYFFIVIGFYINGLLFKKFRPSALYAASLFSSGLAVSLLIFLSTITYASILLFGIVMGVSAGMYWANRNLLTLKSTTSINRIYFSSLDTAFANLTGILIPFLIGWIIAFGENIHWYSTLGGYKIVSVVMLITIAFAGVISNNISLKQKPLTKFSLKNVGENWNKFRAVRFFWGLSWGIIAFAPALMVMILVGKEESLGAIQSIATVFATIIIYLFAKSLDIKYRIKILSIGIFFAFLGSLIFGITYSAVGVLLFFACQAIAAPFTVIGLHSLTYDLIDKETRNDNHFEYVCDQEIYLNAGRIVSIGCFIAIIHFTSPEIALRVAPIVFAASGVCLLFIARSIDKKHLRPPMHQIFN